MRSENDLELIRRAEAVLEGRLELPGRAGRTFVGKDVPAWKQLPEENGDMEAVFVLNRHEHWNTLMDAYCAIGDGRYAARVWREFRSWYEECRCPEIRTDIGYLKEWFDTYSDPEKACWRSLEAGIRMFRVWWRIPKLLFDVPGVRETDRKAFFDSVVQHGEILSKVSPVFFPKADHNHYLMESYGLLQAGCINPQPRQAEEWVRRGALELKRCFLAQITEDGGQIEGCPHYHNESTALMAEAVLTMRSCGIEIEEAIVNRLRRTMEYTLYSTRPTGKNVAFGDSDTTDMGQKAARLGEKAFGGEQAREIVRLLDGLAGGREQSSALPLFHVQRQLGQAFARSGWGSRAASLAVICRTPVQNEHSHMDACSFEFTAFGKTMLTDPGRFTYREGEERRRFKCAGFHNTLTISGRDPFAYLGTWKYGEQRPAYIVDASDGRIRMRQEAYLPVAHEREIAFWLAGDRPLLVIRDEVSGLRNGEFAELCFHLDFTDTELARGGAGIWARDEEAKVTCYLRTYPAGKGQIEPGMVSERMDCFRESRRYLSRFAGDGERLCLTTVIAAVGRIIGTQEMERFEETVREEALRRIGGRAL